MFDSCPELLERHKHGLVAKHWRDGFRIELRYEPIDDCIAGLKIQTLGYRAFVFEAYSQNTLQAVLSAPTLLETLEQAKY